MGLTKISYIKGKTALSADNLNDIQDNVISNKKEIDKISKDISELKAILENIQNKFENSNNTFNNFEKKLNKLNEENYSIENHYNKFTKFEKNFEEISEKMSSLNKVIISTEEPEEPKEGDIWFNPEDENILIIENILTNNENLITGKGISEALKSKLNLIKIWENPSPNSCFLNSTLKCKDLNYTLFLGIFLKSNLEKDIYLTSFGFLNMNNYISSNGESRIWKPTLEGINFNSLTHDNTLIPYQIYGIV